MSPAPQGFQDQEDPTGTSPGQSSFPDEISNVGEANENNAVEVEPSESYTTLKKLITWFHLTLSSQIKNEIKGVTNELRLLDQKITCLDQKLKAADQAILNHDKSIELLSRQNEILEYQLNEQQNEANLRNLMIFGWSEVDKATVRDKVKDLGMTHLGISGFNIEDHEIRILKSTPPIVKLCFRSYEVKAQFRAAFLSKREALPVQFKKLRVSDDLTPLSRKRRKHLLEIIKDLKEKGVKVILRSDYLILDKKRWTYSFRSKSLVDTRSFLEHPIGQVQEGIECQKQGCDIVGVECPGIKI